MKYIIDGKVRLGRLEHKFEKTVDAQNEAVAKEHILSDMGGKYSISRRKIKIENVKRKEEK